MSNISLVNIDLAKIELPFNIHKSTDSKFEKIFQLLFAKTVNDRDKEIIIQAIEACKCNTYTETRFLNVGGFSFARRKVTKTTHIVK